MDKDKMIEDIVAMLDGSVKKGDGHINVQVNEVEEDPKEIKEEKQDTYPATDFVLQDQYGKEHSLADYKGKTIFLNF